MNHLDVGVDKGFSKTNLVVARTDECLLLEARIEHFDQVHQQPITDERLLRAIVQNLTPFNWNAMYYDRANHVHCFASPRAIWDEVPHSFEGITFARFLLAWWCQAWDRGTQTPLANEILARTGLSATALREQVEQDPMLDTLPPPWWPALGPLISQHASEEPVVSFLDQGVNQLRHLYERFCAQVKSASPPWLVLGGPIWSRVLFERVQGVLAHVGIPVKHSQGDPAWGAIRFRRTNPAVQLEPWAFRFIRQGDGA
jgi:hypothetical protein